MLVLNPEKVIRSMSAKHPPAARARPGDTVKFISMDAFGDQYASAFSGVFDENKAHNPATGPLFVEGAEPGDTLKVTILNVEFPTESCCMTLSPGLGVFGNEIRAPKHALFPLRDGMIRFNERLQLPVEPMVGVIGVAPKDGEIGNAYPGPHGGNMDCKRIGIGASVYLPVYHHGALLALGDVHALMGDGEASINGAEARAETTVRIELIKRSFEAILVVDAQHVMTICSGKTLEEASFDAARAMRKLLVEELGMGLFESSCIMSLVCDMRINEVVNPMMCCRAEIPLSLFKAYGYRFA